MNLEQTIIKNLLENNEYLKRSLPYLKKEYFTNQNERIIFEIVSEYTLRYNKAPSINEIEIELVNKKGINEDSLSNTKVILENIRANTDTNNIEWLIDNTEKFCQDKAIYLAMLQSMNILEGRDKKHSTGQIPAILSEALAISFDPDVGHDYTEDYDKQYDHYHRLENKIRFDLADFNKITNGGIPEKKLLVAMAGIHVGKSLLMCHMAAGFLAQGYDVLYITLEMGQEEIVQRIDANLMNVPHNDIVNLSKDDYEKKASLLKAKTTGKLIVKEYPTASASVVHFRALLDELRLKKNFKPQIIFVDYINICASSRFRPGTAGMYEFVKAIGEELRGLAVEYKTRVFTATQLNREGYKSSEPDMTNTAESFGLPAIADFMFAIVSNEQLQKLGQYLIIQLKNRLGDMHLQHKFIIGVDRPKMRLYDVNDSSAGLQIETKTVDSNSKFKSIKV